MNNGERMKWSEERRVQLKAISQTEKQRKERLRLKLAEKNCQEEGGQEGIASSSNDQTFDQKPSNLKNI
jgi:hypothetical protein